MKINNSLLMPALIAMALTSCGHKEAAPVENIPVIEKALNDSSSTFFADFDAYPEDLRGLPIGVFDSGTGGLTVLEKLLSLDSFDNISGAVGADNILDFAGEHFVYLADQANMPYGLYEANGNAGYLRELVAKDALFLMGDKYYENSVQSLPSGAKTPVKIIVVACNTATAYGLDDIRKMLELSNTGVKVIGVINAGAKAALDKFRNETEPYAIGVLATNGTIASGAYERTLKEMIAERGIGTPVTIVNQNGNGFAESVDSDPDYVNPALSAPREGYRGPKLGTGSDDIRQNLMSVYNFDYSDNNMLFNVDENGLKTEVQLNSAANYARLNLVSLIERHRASGSTAPLKAVILGCTHYPFMLETLKQVIDELRKYTAPDGSKPYASVIDSDFTFIDPAFYTAVECYNTLRADGNLAFRTTQTQVSAFISVPSYGLSQENLTGTGALEYGYKFGRKPGSEEITTKQVPFTRNNIDESNFQRIEERLPHSFQLISRTML